MTCHYLSFKLPATLCPRFTSHLSFSHSHYHYILLFLSPPSRPRSLLLTPIYRTPPTLPLWSYLLSTLLLLTLRNRSWLLRVPWCLQKWCKGYAVVVVVVGSVVGDGGAVLLLVVLWLFFILNRHMQVQIIEPSELTNYISPENLPKFLGGEIDWGNVIFFVC